MESSLNEGEGKKSLTVRIDAQDEREYREYMQHFKNQSELFSAMLRALKQTTSIEKEKLRKDLQEVTNYTDAIYKLFHRIVSKSLTLEEQVQAEAQKKYGDLQMQVETLEASLKTAKETFNDSVATAVQIEREKGEKKLQEQAEALQTLQNTITDLKNQLISANRERLEAVALAHTREAAAKESDDLRAQVAAQTKQLQALAEQHQKELEAERRQVHEQEEKTRHAAEEQIRTLEKQLKLEKEQALLDQRTELNQELEKVREKAYQQFLLFESKKQP